MRDNAPVIAGVIIGPHALQLVVDPALVNDAAEIGVILLLFTIGIEFSLEKLWRIKTLIFGGGGLRCKLPDGGIECDRQRRIAAHQRTPTQFEPFTLALERHLESLG